MIAASSTDPRALNSAGLAAQRAGDLPAAIAAFAAAIAADPAAPALWRNLAAAHRLAGDDAGEGGALDAALAIDRTDFAAWLRKAQLHQRRAEDGAALAAWSGVLQLAAGLPAPPPPLAAELDAGAAYLAQVQARLHGAVTGALRTPLDALTGRSAARARTFVDAALGRRRVYANQCAGLHYPFLPADEFFDDAHFPWFAAFAAHTPAIRAELEALLADPAPPLRPYVQLDIGTPANDWSPLDGSLDWGACFLWEYGVPNQPLLDRCPATAAAFAFVPQAQIPGRAPTVFFSLLRPHTRIPPHTGVSNTRAIIHLPLIVPAGCGFRVGGETRAWMVGQPLAFDDTIEHEAWNDSDQLRAVLIFDVWNPHLTVEEQAIIADYCVAADATGLGPPRAD